MNLSMKIQCFRFNENTILRQNKKKSHRLKLLHCFIYSHDQRKEKKNKFEKIKNERRENAT